MKKIKMFLALILGVSCSVLAVFCIACGKKDNSSSQVDSSSVAALSSDSSSSSSHQQPANPPAPNPGTQANPQELSLGDNNIETIPFGDLYVSFEQAGEYVLTFTNELLLVAYGGDTYAIAGLGGTIEFTVAEGESAVFVITSSDGRALETVLNVSGK
ncbi:MAG: hypothetical protein IKA88_04795 [Clostridia bacterium]|nr:hypothetical protein [Clostridia bacterium]